MYQDEGRGGRHHHTNEEIYYQVLDRDLISDRMFNIYLSEISDRLRRSFAAAKRLPKAGNKERGHD